MSTYWNSPDLVSFPPDQPVERGYESVAKGMREFIESMPGVKIEMADPTYLIAGEYVVTLGTFKMTVRTPEGGTQVMNGRYTDVKTEKDGKWVYVHDHASVPLPPPSGDEE